MANIKRILDSLPENVYCRSPQTKIFTLLSALLGTADNLEMRTYMTWLNLFIRTCRYQALDDIFGSIFSIYRMTEEKYPYNPLTDFLTPEQWMEVEAKDAKYRNRLIKFVEACNTEGLLGIKKVVEAATGSWAEVYDQRDFGPGVNDPINDPEGFFEFIVVPLKPDWTEADSLRTKLLLDRIKPAHLTYRIEPEITRLNEVDIESISASSSFFLIEHEVDIWHYTKEYDTPNKINGVSNASSELIIQEEVGRKDPKSIITNNAVNKTEASGSPFVFRNIRYHSSSTVPWYGHTDPDPTPYPDPNIYGHYGEHAFDGNESTYWVSVGNASPNSYYSYEWIECEVMENEEGTGFNEIWVKFPWDSNMAMWVCVMDKNGNWWNLGGDVIPYGDYPVGGAKEYPYPCKPNGSDTPYAFYFDNVSKYKDSDGWWKFYLGKWFPDTKFVRLTFTNLDLTNIGTYKHRAAVTEFRVVANLVDYYGGWRASSYTYEPEVPWISQAVNESDSSSVWLKAILSKSQQINRIKITRGERSKSQVVIIKDKNGGTIKDNVSLSSKETIIAFSSRTLSEFYIYPKKMEKLSILSGKYGLEICKVRAWFEEYIPGEVITVTKKPYPAKYACDASTETYWHTEYRNSSKETTEWIELTLTLESGKNYTYINRVSILAADRGLSYRILYYTPEGGKFVWRYADIMNLSESEKDYSMVFFFRNTVKAAGIRVEISNLANVGKGKYAARIKDIRAWLHIVDIEEMGEVKEIVSTKEWEIGNINDGNEYTLWRSGGALSPDCVEAINITLPSSAGAIAGFYTDPEIPGVAMNILYSKDGVTYTCFHHDYWLERGMTWLPYPINAKYWKLEFTNLKPNTYATKSWENTVIQRRYDLDIREEARILGYPYSKPVGGYKVPPLEDQSYSKIFLPYKIEKKEAERPLRYYVGIREMKIYSLEGIGRNPYEILENFEDNSGISPSATVYWDEDNSCISTSGEAIFISKPFNLATSVKSISFEVDESTPEDKTATWYATSNGINWYEIDSIKNEDNTWFVFPEEGDQLAVKCEISGEGDYVCNEYTIKLTYFIEM